MNAKQYAAAIRVSTEAALKSGQISLPEIIGTLQLAVINTERVCFQHALQVADDQAHEAAGKIIPATTVFVPPR